MSDTKQITLPITGMTCANCSATIERNLQEDAGRDGRVRSTTPPRRRPWRLIRRKSTQDQMRSLIGDLGYGVATAQDRDSGQRHDVRQLLGDDRAQPEEDAGRGQRQRQLGDRARRPSSSSPRWSATATSRQKIEDVGYGVIESAAASRESPHDVEAAGARDGDRPAAASAHGSAWRSPCRSSCSAWP